MALSIAELELQTAEYLPAREVMSTCGRDSKKKHSYDSWRYEDNDGQDFDSGDGDDINVLNNVAVASFNGDDGVDIV